MTTTNIPEYVASILFVRNEYNPSLYWVVKKDRERISGFLGRFPFAASSNIVVEGILLDYDLQDDGENWEWSFYATNRHAITAKRKEYLDRGITNARLTGFTLNADQQAYGSWYKYRLLIKFSKDWKELEIQFYEMADK